MANRLDLRSDANLLGSWPRSILFAFVFPANKVLTFWTYEYMLLNKFVLPCRNTKHHGWRNSSCSCSLAVFALCLTSHVMCGTELILVVCRYKTYRHNRNTVKPLKTGHLHNLMKVLTQSERFLQITFLLKVITLLLLPIKTLLYKNHYTI